MSQIVEPGNGARDRQKIVSNFNYYILAGGEDPKEWCINPLTPVPPITARDEPWPFFHF